MLLLTANTWRATKLPYAAIKDQLASINNCRQSHDVEPSGDGSTHQHRLVASSAMPENLATQPQHQQINDSGILHHGVLNITKSSRDNCSFCRAPQSHAAKTRDICCAARKRKKQYSFRITRTRDTPRVAAVICGVADSCEVARLCFFLTAVVLLEYRVIRGVLCCTHAGGCDAFCWPHVARVGGVQVDWTRVLCEY